ncbi:nuclear transport factor 2 family protein [Zunongwangia sp. F363]|uniref:Nuclear transport factor 2 family protein n=1 Tax=Autumnicola tepida TaxID=3075595 RepID=A0ABU3C8E2_9FLAO|nr:nuclear transport factor 2 family protein [Zunongwangia sp. F363]MDT0642571.1 nuclear transport factor 2 family protein [Zunongwangia sp. F363]
MKTSNLKTILALFLIVTALGYGQNETNIEKEAVINVMKTYKDALQNLTTEGTFDLFTEESEVFESGGVEGTYAHYIEHHLGPELGHFEKFEFSDYEIDASVDLPYAFTTETYIYTIVLNPDENGNTRTIKKKGVATSILKKIDSQWKITKMHSSSRNVK